MKRLRYVGVLAHPTRPHTDAVAEAIARSLEEHHLQVWLYTRWEVTEVQECARSADMVIAIGGDGAMLRAARVCAPYGVPVLGVNMGRLGFLTEIARPEDWEQIMPRLLAGDYWIERRMMITASVVRDSAVIASEDALNDVVISGLSFGRMIQLDAYIDKNWTTTYNADALIIATATGSTAYALASGGPILPPDLLNILIVPASPHLSMDRSIVLSEGSVVDIYPSSSNRHEIVVSTDGLEVARARQGDCINVRASKHSSRFARLRDRNYFYRSLLDKLEPRVNRSAPEHEDSNQKN